LLECCAGEGDVAETFHLRSIFNGALKRRISNFRQDDAGDWIAVLECGHTQHMRHNPPWTVRDWVTTAEGRAEFLGHELCCPECESRRS
jgi:hypothetical protein